MTIDFVMQTIPRRMAELGFGDNYRYRVRSVLVPGNGEVVMRSWNTWNYFPLEYLDRAFGLVVESDVGYLDIASAKFSENQFEHTGKITLRNSSAQPVHCHLIAVTPFCKPRKPQL
jgi:hypothetical protein